MGYPIFHSQYTAAQIEASIGKTPRIKASTRTWEIWDIATSAYVDTGVSIDTQLFVDPNLTEAGYAADAKVVGDNFRDTIESVECAVLTPGLSVTVGGVTFSLENNAIKAYGTSTAARRLLCLNGQAQGATTSTTFKKTFDPGVYALETHFSKSMNVNWQYTYTTFASGVPSVTSNTPKKVEEFTAPVMFGLTFSTRTNFGTESDPTYITISAQRLTAVDWVARGTAGSALDLVQSAVAYTEQAPSAAQAAQARANLDTMSNDTLFDFNSYDVLEYGSKVSKTHSGVSYVYNADGSWTISGTATALSRCNLIESMSTMPRFIVPGRRYKILLNGGTVALQVFWYEGGSYTSYETYTEDAEFTVPEVDGVLIRLMVPDGAQVSTTVHYKVIAIDYGASTGVINNYYYPSTTLNKTEQIFNNTYDINVSPTITTDTNGWLQSVDTNTSEETGKTDMAPAIMAMLTETGYCHLGPGIFYVSGNIDMPEGSVLCGCGSTTIVRLLSSVASGYAIKMQSYNILRDMIVSGKYSAISVTTRGTRTGVLFAANHDGSEGETAFDSNFCTIENVWFENFSDSGLRCHNTSNNVRKGLHAIGIFARNCWAGINLDYYSEFNKFVNVCTSLCRYGCINNCGNNVFTSCTFHANSIGFYVDGTQPNSGHGTINGCTFCHVGSNAGSAITIENMQNGFVISDTQIWYCSVDLTDSSGVSFVGCEFGRGTTDGGATINVSGGNLVLFSGCTFMNDVTYPPDFNIENNTKVRVLGCFGSASGEEITPD